MVRTGMDMGDRQLGALETERDRKIKTNENGIFSFIILENGLSSLCISTLQGPATAMTIATAATATAATIHKFMYFISNVYVQYIVYTSIYDINTRRTKCI